MRIGEQIFLTGSQKRTYAGQVTCAKANDSEIAQAGLREDNAGDNEYATRDKSTYRVGEDVLEHDSGVLSAESSCNENVFLILESVELHSRTARHTYPSR